MNSNEISNLSDTSDQSKIGEIYFINKTFRIFCNCGTKFNKIKIFTMHFLQEHLNINNQSIKVLDELLINKAGNQIDDSLELNDENPIAIDTVDKKKIGEIYFINKTFRIFCICGTRFNNIKIFTMHFLQDHLNLNNKSIKVLDELLIFKANQIDESLELNDGDNLRDPIDVSEDFSESVYNENSMSDSETSNFNINLENDNANINNETISTKEYLNDKTDNVNDSEEDDVILFSDEKKIDYIKKVKAKNEGEPKKEIWTCYPCGETFDEQKTFVKHNDVCLRQSFEITKYKCKWCDRMYNKPDHCTYHENNHHDSSGKLIPRKYKKTLNHICEKCGSRFLLPVKLREHIRMEHTGERPLKCDMCSESFARKRDLRIHKYSHMKEHPYKCDYCDKGFFVKNVLNTHEMIHTGIRKFECKLCEKKYRRSSDLKRHMKRTHKINTNSK